MEYEIVDHFHNYFRISKNVEQTCSVVDDIKKIQSAVLMNALKGSSSQRERTQKANIKI